MSEDWTDYITTQDGTYVRADEAEAIIAALQSTIRSAETIHLGDILHLEELINEAEAEWAKLRDIICQWRDSYSNVVRERNKRFPVDEVQAWQDDLDIAHNANDPIMGLVAWRERQKDQPGNALTASR